MVNSHSFPLFILPQGSLACSCADCQSSCPIIPDTWDAPGEPWIMFGYDGLAVAMALTAVLFSVSFLVVFAYCHKRNKRYTGEWVEAFGVSSWLSVFVSLPCPTFMFVGLLDVSLLGVPLFFSLSFWCVPCTFTFHCYSFNITICLFLRECPFFHNYFQHSDSLCFCSCVLNSVKFKCFSFALYSLYCISVCHE